MARTAHHAFSYQSTLLPAARYGARLPGGRDLTHPERLGHVGSAAPPPLLVGEPELSAGVPEPLFGVPVDSPPTTGVGLAEPPEPARCVPGRTGAAATAAAGGKQDT
jgi:hypothetical protein